jgi:short-subunit dehydrogenase
VAGDVTDAAHRDQLLQRIRQQTGRLDILVNNAGVGAIGRFDRSTAERLRQIMEVNFFAPVELIRAALDLLRRGRDPIVANIGSVLGHRAVPRKCEYCASKFALRGFTDSIRSELKSSGIDVILVSPSTTSSEFFDRLLENDAAAVQNPYRMPPDKVARTVLAALRRGRREVILPWSGKALVWLDRLFPALSDRIVERFG